jgi:prepilin-type N-terminal cleavage/methylation domain-containing protein
MNARRGFTLAEMVIVLSIFGILTTIATPRIRASLARAEGAALAERVYGVRLAYESAGEPDAESLAAADGTVPAGLAQMLSDGHFDGEGDVTLSIVGKGRLAFVALRSPTPRAEQARWYFHTLSKVAHLHTSTVTLVPLSDAAIAMVPSSTGTIAGTGQPTVATADSTPITPPNPSQTPVVQTAVPPQGPVMQPVVAQPAVTQPVPTQTPSTQTPVTQPPTTQPPTTQPPTTQPPTTQPPVTQPPVTQPPVTQPTPAKIPSPTVQPPAQATPTCSSSLPPGQYKNCINGATNHGWFHNHH